MEASHEDESGELDRVAAVLQDSFGISPTEAPLEARRQVRLAARAPVPSPLPLVRGEHSHRHALYGVEAARAVPPKQAAARRCSRSQRTKNRIQALSWQWPRSWHPSPRWL